ncbi:MAG TPA: hypothetical protein VGP93_01950, partial [Polyangiaceae bacterium]|nr:hypothetical protein [Polyangiaceae bacterium]
MQHVIAKSPEHAQDPVFVVPEAPFPLGTGLIVADSECALLIKNGQVLGTLGPGRHALDPNYLPFLWNARDASGNFQASVIFLSLAALGSRFACSETFTLGSGSQVSLRAYGSAR